MSPSLSLRIGSVLGIEVRVHLLLVVLLVVLAFLGSAHGNGLTNLLLPCLLFGVVLLHELGHYIVAQHFGVRVLDITLWPLGGIARMEALPESARIEGWGAIAGPLVNFALVALFIPLWLWLDAQGTSPRWLDLVEWFLGANLTLGLFNLLPAFPMDGGRLLRAFLARKGNWLRATELAVRAGRWIAILLAVAGLFGIAEIMRPSVALVFVALFVWWSGSQELALVRQRYGVAAQRFGFSFSMRPNARPATPPPARSRGYTDADIAELERLRGPIAPLPPREGTDP